MSLTGKTALVTGATSGIGFHTASALARMGASVYITGRDTNRGKAAEQQLRAEAGHHNVHFVQADAATVGGNQQLAQDLIAATDHLDILVNNVGGGYNDRWETADGYEATLAMNFVGPFALTEALVPLLRASAPVRIVNLASMSHRWWKGEVFADLHSTESYLTSRVYARSKLLNVMWTLALARRLAGRGVVANSADPGGAWTSMTQAFAPRSMPGWVRPFWPLLRVLQRRGSPEQAARSSIFLASAPAAASMTGKYLDSNVRPATPAPAALDRTNQEQAWELAVRLVSNAPTATHADQVGADQAPAATAMPVM
jgi:NAD(P)-dependent dehydrogenase (short-subunit alcohol dehydrogenase family)